MLYNIVNKDLYLDTFKLNGSRVKVRCESDWLNRLQHLSYTCNVHNINAYITLLNIVEEETIDRSHMHNFQGNLHKQKHPHSSIEWDSSEILWINYVFIIQIITAVILTRIATRWLNQDGMVDNSLNPQLGQG